MDSRRVGNDDSRDLIKRLGDDEKRRLAAFVRPERQRQFLLGRVLLRLALARLVDLSRCDIRIVERPGNAPQVVLPDSVGICPGYSLSHSGPWIACAVSRDIVLGLDIEVIDPARDVIALSQAAFSAEECIWLQRQPHDQQVAGFYHLWSLKEALYKMRAGTGSALPLIDSGGGLLLEGDDWCSYALAHENLSFVLCSAQPLSTVQLVEPTNWF